MTQTDPVTNSRASIESVVRRQRVIPVLTLADVRSAVEVARILAGGGFPAMEITMRTGAALDCMRAIRAEVPDAVVGAGTLIEPLHFDQAIAAGAQFLVSPGATPRLLERARHCDAWWIPGAASVSESLVLREQGVRLQKFFPAESSGGPAWLKAVAPVLADIAFCPTGGVSLANLSGWLACANVFCVGGSWLVPQQALAERRLDVIAQCVHDTADALARLSR